ncbi:YebC/PmpR family DNA-binding transcriptional regulator [Candidatus Berkelbacteria bacterium]|nr:YebC/PmpR family DNA-binding transcriptional regulator [Candidatus Berkelbacteria bacterium]
MSGHSKWSQIKRKKGLTDVKRGQLFSKLSKQLTVAARQGLNLDMASAAARAANMSRETIDRAIAKGIGHADGADFKPALYELYGPGGAGVLVEVLTDNTNRTLGEIRAVINRHGGTLAQTGAVQYLFDRRGIVEVAAGPDAETTQLILIELGAVDVVVDANRVIAYEIPENFATFQTNLKQRGIDVLETRLGWIPTLTIPVEVSATKQLIALMEALDDLDDVVAVETNADLG